MKTMKTTQSKKQEKSETAKVLLMNAEVMLAAWLRTALIAMVFGITLDRFVINFYNNKESLGFWENSQALMKPVGGILVAFSILFAFLAGIRYRLFLKDLKQHYEIGKFPQPWFPLGSSIMVVFFGVLLLLVILFF